MINPLLASALVAGALVVLVSRWYFARLQRREAEEIAAQRKKYTEEASAQWKQALPSFQLPEWKLREPGANESEEDTQEETTDDPRLELTLAQLWANASRETNDPSHANPEPQEPTAA